MSQYSDLIDAARRGTLAHDDQRLQRLRRQANDGSREAQAALDEILAAGGPHGGSVNKVI